MDAICYVLPPSVGFGGHLDLAGCLLNSPDIDGNNPPAKNDLAQKCSACLVMPTGTAIHRPSLICSVVKWDAHVSSCKLTP